MILIEFLKKDYLGILEKKNNESTKLNKTNDKN